MTRARRAHPEPCSTQLAERIASISRPNEMTPTGAPGLTVYAADGPAYRTHVVYRPSLCVVAQGAKVAHIGARAYPYDATRYFFSSIPVPAELEVARATPRLLGLVLELDLELVGRVALEVDEITERDGATEREDVQAAFNGVLTDRLAATLERLVATATDPIRRHVLYLGVVREVVLELLLGREGTRLRRALRTQGRLRAIVESARHIDASFREPLSVAQLARRAGMSESSYYQHFRDATQLSPLQYLKRIRLVHARAAITAGRSVTEAAFDVGYGSTSQFSREFRAAFGVTPSSLGGAAPP